MPLDPETARQNVLAWISWWMRAYPETCGTKAELARQLGVSRPSITQLLDPLNMRAPAFSTILALTQVTGIPFETLTARKPPELPSCYPCRAIRPGDPDRS